MLAFSLLALSLLAVVLGGVWLIVHDVQAWPQFDARLDHGDEE